jgi:4-amino-4-deoxy-L-arabinose transferase-like glycosyltransferase
MNDSPSMGEGKPRLYILLMVVVLLMAAALRIVALREAPPGPRFDETFDALMARRILNGERPLYFAENFGEEPLNQYLQAGAFTAFGWNDIALRFPSVAFGLIEVVAVYALGKRTWNRRAGLFAAALCAGSFWAIFFSRLGMRLIALTALASLGVLMLGRLHASRARGERWGMAGAAGVLLGLAVHTYTAARALPVLIVGCLAYLAIWHRADLRRQAMNWALVILIASLIAAPLVDYLASHPQAEPRVGQVSGPLDALRQGNVAPLLNYTLAAIGMFAVRGGTEWLYNLPGRPIFDPLTALVFFVGIIAALRKWRKARTAFALIWLGAGLAPILLSWPPASESHAILAQPAVYLVAGLGLDTILVILSKATLAPALARSASAGENPFPAGQRLFALLKVTDWGERLKSLLPIVLSLVVIALNAGLSAHDYFGVWNVSDAVRWEHQATVTEMGRYADAHPELRDVAFAGTAIDYYSPWMKVGHSLTSRRRDARWFNPARALVWNPSGPMTYLIPFRDPNPVTFNQTVREMFFGAARLTLDSKLADGRPVFTAYEMPDAAALHTEAMAAGIHPLDFDGRWTLIGYEVYPTQARPGDSIRVVTYWRVARANDSPLMMFAHLLGPDGKLVVQEDRLDVAPETLRVGDEFLQTHRMALADDAPPGTYHVAIGLYSPVTNLRVPVVGSDRVEFSLVVK